MIETAKPRWGIRILLVVVSTVALIWGACVLTLLFGLFFWNRDARSLPNAVSRTNAAPVTAIRSPAAIFIQKTLTVVRCIHCTFRCELSRLTAQQSTDRSAVRRLPAPSPASNPPSKSCAIRYACPVSVPSEAAASAFHSPMVEGIASPRRPA